MIRIAIQKSGRLNQESLALLEELWNFYRQWKRPIESSCAPTSP